MERMKLKVTPARLRQVMRRKRLGVRDLAAMAQTSPSTMSRLASGVQSVCRSDLAARIEDALAEDAGSLFGELESRPKTANVEDVAPSAGDIAAPKVAHDSLESKNREAAA